MPPPPPQHATDAKSPLPAPVIGIAGGIGSGKSEVARLLGEMGCIESHSDDNVREVLMQPEVRDTLVGWWGRAILNAVGEVDRSAVARIVFNDEAQRRRLEGFVHPLVDAKRKKYWADAAAEGSVAAFVIDAPLLFEAGLDRRCDAVIFVDAPESVRQERVRASRGWDAGELRRREKNQWPLESKRER
ncbi:MAG: dephospho-CoA kinase, partial [bacterium]